MKPDSTKIKILHTVYPDDPIDEASWLKYTKAGRLHNKAEVLDRAKDMMRQYLVNDRLPEEYYQIVNDWKV